MKKIKSWLIKRLKWMIRKLGGEVETKENFNYSPIVQYQRAKVVTYKSGYRVCPLSYTDLNLYKKDIENPFPVKEEIIEILSRQFLDAVKKNMNVQWVPDTINRDYGYVATLKIVERNE